ncbi:hypothetical protein BKA56DRAFT_576792 [Ilyonectria sp. MPI-CAGE-AT-0026]|nr:hypothetical protein BKA56DRAFT_576792 [Ilyonectria sp. MPI-CAGE-AT-0026]
MLGQQDWRGAWNRPDRASRGLALALLALLTLGPGLTLPTRYIQGTCAVRLRPPCRVCDGVRDPVDECAWHVPLSTAHLRCFICCVLYAVLCCAVLCCAALRYAALFSFACVLLHDDDDNTALLSQTSATHPNCDCATHIPR